MLLPCQPTRISRPRFSYLRIYLQDDGYIIVYRRKFSDEFALQVIFFSESPRAQEPI
jgi:hypothetical protein